MVKLHHRITAETGKLATSLVKPADRIPPRDLAANRVDGQLTVTGRGKVLERNPCFASYRKLKGHHATARGTC